MAATGLFLCAFLVEHLYGNIFLLYNDGGETFNEWSHTLVHSLFIRIVEVLLFASILIHVAQAIRLTRQNAQARPVKYAVYKVGETSNWFSRNMGITGSLILFFIVVHLWHFFVPYRITGEVGGEGQLTLAQAVKTGFQNGGYVALYVASVMFLAFHLNHGFQSAFQSLGVNNKLYTPVLKTAGSVFAFGVVGLGFSCIPVLIYFGICGGNI